MSLDSYRQYYLDQPHEVSLETIALCNARCTFCPYTTMERIGTKMPDELLDKVVEEMATFEKPFFFSPFKVNEPLLDKRTLPLLRKVNEKCPNALLRIFTNGQALTLDKVEEIAELGNVMHLWVSLNSVDPDEYRQLMGLDFEKTAKRLDALHELDFPHEVVLSTVGYPNEKFRYYCWERWPGFQSLALKEDGWLGDIHDDEEIPDTPCIRWFELSITATGVVSLCCMDGQARFPIGDITKQSLLEVYNDPKWRDRRERMLSRREVYPCSTCSY